MRSFQIKDLTVTLNPQTAGANQGILCHLGCSIHITPICHLGCSFYYPSVCHFGCSIYGISHVCHQGCTFILPSIVITPTIHDWQTPVEAGLPNYNKSELEQLRAGIAELQTKVEAQLKQAPEDLDLLESKMKEALEEISRQKASANTNANKGK